MTIDSTVKTVYNLTTFGEDLDREHDPGDQPPRSTPTKDWKNGDHTDAESLVANFGLFTNDYLEFLLPEGTSDNIYVYYEGPTGQLELGQTDVQGGLVVLYGDVLNTGSGTINVLDGHTDPSMSSTTRIIPW